MAPRKSKQIRHTVSTGSNTDGEVRLAFWKEAALKKMGSAKLLDAWIRSVLDAEAKRILKQ